MSMETMTMKRKWIDVTRQDLIGLRKKMTGTQIAKKYGVHHNAVYYRMRMFGMTAPKRNRQFDPPKEELESLYKRMSMADIAKHYGVGETIIFSRIRDNGIEPITRSARLSGKPKTLAHRLAMSASAIKSGIRSGARNGNWKGGKNSRNVMARSTASYHEWKAAVLAKSKWKCEWCGKEHGDICKHCGHRILLHAHHVLSFDAYPEKRYDPSNGRALCERCHMTEHHKKIG